MRVESATENYCRHFASANYTADSAKLPYLTVNYQTATNIMISPTSMQISVGQTKQIVSTIYPSGQIIDWSSSNTNIATVSSSGLVTAKGAGNVVITARSQSNSAVYATCNVTVLPAVSSISLPQTVHVSKGDQYTLIPIIQPSNADKTLIWSSSNAEVATVSNGIVTAIGAGTATVTATAVNGKQASCTIIVPELKDGEYYILNSTKQMFITPQGQSQDAGTRQLLSSTVTDMKIQCYRFRLFSNGYYTIQNVKSGKYLGVDSTASGSDLKQYAIYDSDRHYFKLERNASGSYRIVPKANEGSGLAIGGDYGLGGIINSVGLKATSASNVNFDWVISETKYEVTIAPYFDRAFAQRYGNGNDFVAKGVLEELFEEVSEFFKTEFKVRLKVREAQSYVSEPDKCKYGRNVPLLDDLPCPKNPRSPSEEHSCPNAEQLYNRVLNAGIGDLFLNGESGNCTSRRNLEAAFYLDHIVDTLGTDIHIMFTGHKLYNDEIDEGNEDDEKDGMIKECNRSYSMSFEKCIFIQELPEISNYINETKYTLEHEISHQFGAIDHYHEGPKEDEDGNKIICKNAPYCSVCCDGGTQCRPLICKMCNDYVGMYCRECRQDIINYLGSHADNYKFE